MATDLEQATQFINFLKMVGDPAVFQEKITQYQTLVQQANDLLGLVNSKQAFDAYVVKVKAEIKADADQLAADRETHAKEVNAFQETKQRILDEAASTLAEARQKQVEANTTMQEADAKMKAAEGKESDLQSRDSALSRREAALNDREAELNAKAAKLKELFQ